MKDIVIKGSSIKREILIFLLCVVAVMLWNVYGIVKYDTSWRELYSLWYVVGAVSVVIYVVAIPVRLACGVVVRWFRK